ncbi:MAG: hypothetical protein ACJ77C_05205 [Chloroflexota bacterium]
MTTSHQLLGWVVVGLSLALTAVGGWSVAAGVRSSGQVDHRFAVDRTAIVVFLTIGLAVATGVIVLAMDRPPADPIHLLYGAVALTLLPVGYVVGMRTSRPGSGRLLRQRDAWAIATGILLLGIGFRLIGTG